MAGSYWDKFTTQRVTRRRVLQTTGVAAAAGGAVWLVGCGGGDDKKTTTPGATQPAGGSKTPSATANGPTFLNEKNPPVKGGRYVTSTAADFGTWDAQTSVAAAANFFPRIYNLLVNQSTIQPKFFYNDLASKYETDGNKWTFTIRPGVKIGPNNLGVPERDMTADDAVATYERIKSEPKAGNGALKPYLESVSASGSTFTLNTTKPYAYLLNRVGTFTSTIPPRELVENPSKMSTQSAGGGPFRLTQGTEGDVAVMERNPSYYGKDDRNGGAQLPYLDAIELRVIRDRATVRTSFQDGQLTVYGADSKADADDLARDSRFGVTKDPSTTFISVAMNPEKDPFKDIRVRQAIAFAINRQEYVDLVYQGEAEADGLVPWILGDFAFRGDELAALQPFDLAEAKKLVSAVGGITIKMMYPSNSAVEQHVDHLPIFLAQMDAAGIKIEQDPKDFGTWYTDYQTLNYTMSLSLNQSYETPEVPLDAHAKAGPLADRSFFIGLNDPEIDAAIDKTKTTLDLEEQVKAVRDAQKLIYSKGPTWLPLVSPFNYGVYNKKLHNLATGLGPSTNGLVGTASWIEA